MKTLLTTLAFISIVCSCAFGQSPWVVPPGAPLYTNGVWLVHAEITELHSPQPGTVWGCAQEAEQLGVGARRFWKRFFCTTDDGQTWQDANIVNLANGISSVSPLGARTAWALHTQGGVQSLLHTTTGMNGFAPLSSTLPVAFSKIHFFSATNGIAIGESTSSATWAIYRTTDGGLTWAAIPNPPTRTPSNDIKRIISLAPSRATTAWLQSTNGTLLRTTDAGLTWATTPSVSNNVSFEDELNGLYSYFSGSAPRVLHIMRTTDGGLTWTDVPFTGTSVAFSTMTAVPNSPGTYLGYSYRYPGANNLAAGTVYVSRDRGTTWQVTDANFTSGQASFLVASPGQLWVGLNGLTRWPNTDDPMIARYGGLALPSRKPRSASSFTAYPNPTTGVFQLAGTLTAGTTARVYDAAGRLCQQSLVSQTAPTLDLSGLPVGLYQVQLTSANGELQNLRVSKE
ncbi:T9SS type A sorting domain-containing protein [Hymenobacter sp. B81]|uniref:T9SS type A sorting domain-containing protein n=1 Tax=Hymenobacter sp. B81 TaxID=3344878 RepID=UPI0037DD61E5